MMETFINCQPINVFLSMFLVYRLLKFLPSFRFTELNCNENIVSSSEVISQPRTFPKTPIQYNWKPDKYPDVLVWRTYTPLELKDFDGTKGSKILFAVNRIIYDVSSGRNFYGPNGPYGNFAGRDASRGLAKQSFDKEMLTPIESKIDQLEGLTDEEKDNLNEWEDLFKSKYTACGKLIENSERSNPPL